MFSPDPLLRTISRPVAKAGLMESSYQMRLEDTDYVRGSHPPHCSCADCTNRRLKRLREGTHRSFISNRPRFGKSSPGEGANTIVGPKAYGRRPRLPDSLKALLLILALSIVGLITSTFVGSFIPFWLLLGFSVLYSIEKWFYYLTRRHKGLGKLYRLLLNLSMLSLLGLLVWLGVKLFSHQLVQDPLVGSLMLLAGFVLFVWMWRVVARNSWRWPSMKLTVFSIVCVLAVLAFAGVSPISEYKDSFLDVFQGSSSYVAQPPVDDSTTSPTDSSTTPAESEEPAIPPEALGIDSRTGEYEHYYIGLVKAPDGVVSGSDCYGQFIVLINNKYAKNPTYSELLDFLRSDRTDAFPYQYTLTVPGFYYGQADDKIDLGRLESIIDGTGEPSPPRICADFAERLHNEAEMAGIRCAYVSVGLTGQGGGHACNAFETTDRGLVYIDCTGTVGSYGPANKDMIVDIRVGDQYNPEYLFPSAGWYIPSGTMGTVTSIYVTWDGDWR